MYTAKRNSIELSLRKTGCGRQKKKSNQISMLAPIAYPIFYPNNPFDTFSPKLYGQIEPKNTVINQKNVFTKNVAFRKILRSKVCSRLQFVFCSFYVL